jgi:hypothetical protein
MAGISNIAAECNNPEDLNPQDFFFSKISRPYLGHTQPSFSLISWDLFLGSKVAGGEADHHHTVQRLRMSGGVPPVPQYAFIVCTMTAFAQYYHCPELYIVISSP